jgi:hypothetical protein
MRCYANSLFRSEAKFPLLRYVSQVGAATAIGEQPIKGLVDAACGARMTVGEALTNLVFAPITKLRVSSCLLYIAVSLRRLVARAEEFNMDSIHIIHTCQPKFTGSVRQQKHLIFY